VQTIFQEFFNLLVKPPGNLVYHLVLAFSIISALQGAINSNAPARKKNRTLIGLVMLLLGQFTIFIASGLAWQGIIPARPFIPVLDRGRLQPGMGDMDMVFFQRKPIWGYSYRLRQPGLADPDCLFHLSLEC